MENYFDVTDQNLNVQKKIYFTLHLGVNIRTRGFTLDNDNNTVYVLYDYFPTQSTSESYLVRCELNAIVIHCDKDLLVSKNVNNNPNFIVIDQSSNIYFTQGGNNTIFLYSINGRSMSFNWKQTIAGSLSQYQDAPPFSLSNDGNLVVVYNTINNITNFSTLIISIYNQSKKLFYFLFLFDTYFKHL